MDPMKAARLISEKRKALGLTQAELGEKLNVTDKAVSKWERGISLPDVAIMKRLATVLKVDVLEFLGEGLGDIAQSSNIHNSEIAGELEDVLNPEITVCLEPETDTVSPLLFGCNLEHTRSCIYTGLSAQLLKNRKFVGKPSAASGHAAQWYPIGERPLFVFDKPYTRHHALYHMKRNHECNAQRIVNAWEGTLCGIGQHELSLAADKAYAFRIVAQVSAPVTLSVALTSRHGKQVYAQAELSLSGDEWNTYEATLIPDTCDGDADIRLTFTDKASVSLGAVSLLPGDAFRGMRRDVIRELKTAGIRLLRWPGGNFAGEYNWLDGLLPVDMRAPFESCLGIETQPHTMGYDFHEINTDDFIALCREVGAEPYITINPCWNTPEENAAWVEYCNGAADTAYGRLRAENGFAEPYNVRFWSLGNEFGYGHMEGENTPEGYARIAMENAKAMLAVSPNLRLCSSGPYPNTQWAQHSVRALEPVADLVSQHYYSHNPEYPDAEDFRKEYYACLSGVKYLQQQLRDNRADLPDSVKISMDEWNVWYAWYRPSNVTDGIFTALNFHMLLSEAKACGIELACHFEAINEGVIAVTADNAYPTAQGQVFALMRHHQGGRICHSGLDAFATEKDGVITLTAVNPSYDEEKRITLKGPGKILESVILTGETVLPPSFFTRGEVKMENGSFVMPPHSVLFVQMKA